MTLSEMADDIGISESGMSVNLKRYGIDKPVVHRKKPSGRKSVITVEEIEGGTPRSVADAHNVSVETVTRRAWRTGAIPDGERLRGIILDMERDAMTMRFSDMARKYGYTERAVRRAMDILGVSEARFEWTGKKGSGTLLARAARSVTEGRSGAKGL